MLSERHIEDRIGRDPSSSNRTEVPGARGGTGRARSRERPPPPPRFRWSLPPPAPLSVRSSPEQSGTRCVFVAPPHPNEECGGLRIRFLCIQYKDFPLQKTVWGGGGVEVPAETKGWGGSGGTPIAVAWDTVRLTVTLGPRRFETRARRTVGVGTGVETSCERRERGMVGRNPGRLANGRIEPVVRPDDRPGSTPGEGSV